MTCETRRCFGHNWPPLATRRSAKCLVESGAFASESHEESAVDALCRRTGQCNFPALYFLKPRKFNSSTGSTLDPLATCQGGSWQQSKALKLFIILCLRSWELSGNQGETSWGPTSIQCRHPRTGGRIHRFREFIIFHGDRIYPEYVVAYRRE